jgi:PPOX class probable F420-dependent enzyme
MNDSLPAKAKSWLDGKAFVTLGTSEPDGQIQLSAVWAKREGDDILVSTVAGRRKHLNLLRDERASILIIGPDDPYEFLEVRGVVSMSSEGGRELIDDLSEKYRGSRPYVGDELETVRVILRLTPHKVRFRG